MSIRSMMEVIGRIVAQNLDIRISEAPLQPKCIVQPLMACFYLRAGTPLQVGSPDKFKEHWTTMLPSIVLQSRS